MIKVGICGFGYWGPNLLRNFATNPGFCPVAVAERICHACAKKLEGKFSLRCANQFRARNQSTSESVFDWMLRVYETGLTWVLRHQFLTMMVTLLTIATTVGLYIYVPKGFFPQQDTGRLTGSILADPSEDGR